jgi:DnaJ-class molecular chaperone
MEEQGGAPKPRKKKRRLKIANLTSAQFEALDHYRRLGVTRDSAPPEIKTGFRKRVLVLHPDKAGDTPDKNRRFVLCKEAFEVLSDPGKRAAYNRELAAREAAAALRPASPPSPPAAPAPVPSREEVKDQKIKDLMERLRRVRADHDAQKAAEAQRATDDFTGQVAHLWQSGNKGWAAAWFALNVLAQSKKKR